MIDVAHAYIHNAVDQMYQSPPPLMNKPENLQNTKAMHAHQNKPNKPKVKCDEAEIEDSATRGRVTRYGNSSS